MTNHPVRESTGSARFGEDEKVVQSHPLLPGARPPRIGRTDLWDLNDVVERPVNQNAANCRVIFAGLTPAWNLRARENGNGLAQPPPSQPSWSASALHLIRVNREPALRAGTLARPGAGRCPPGARRQA